MCSAAAAVLAKASLIEDCNQSPNIYRTLFTVCNAFVAAYAS